MQCSALQPHVPYLYDYRCYTVHIRLVLTQVVPLTMKVWATGRMCYTVAPSAWVVQGLGREVAHPGILSACLLLFSLICVGRLLIIHFLRVLVVCLSVCIPVCVQCCSEANLFR